MSEPRQRRARTGTMMRAAALSVALVAVLTGCLNPRRPRTTTTTTAPTPGPYTQELQAAAPGTTPWFCNAAGDGTPLSGHGNGAHVNPLYEGQEKGPLSAEDCATLARQLDETLAAVQKWDTRAKAEADGWIASAEYLGGLGTHHVMGQQNIMAGLWNTQFDHRKPMFLVFGGSDGDAPLVGVSFALGGSSRPPEGYAGNNDWWHLHEKICLDFNSGTWPPRILAGAEQIPDADCTAQRGFNATIPNGGMWLLHLWPVPPHQYKLDLFASGHNCLLEERIAPDDDPCWELARRDPALGLPEGAGGDHGGGDHGGGDQSGGDQSGDQGGGDHHGSGDHGADGHGH